MSVLDTETTAQPVEYVCPRCDGMVARDDAVCPHCGQVLEAVAAEQVLEAVAAEEEEPRPTPEPPAVRQGPTTTDFDRLAVELEKPGARQAVLSLLMIPAWFIAVVTLMATHSTAAGIISFFAIFVLPGVGIHLGRRAVRLGERGLGKAGIIANALALGVLPALFIILVVLVAIAGGFDPG